ncbi:hypothetical protein [Maribacter sp. Hel_I_7]|uniref:hypothetical protein n=1 Tax=Maribacter sp. Hel_I_7 TaxID=1249997 RepID=UPI00047CAE16|nr:hypothetical protein [Maribacter sp. Hel_I_7]
MGEIVEKFWYQELDWSMIWVCTGGILVTIMAIGTGITQKNLYGVDNYFKGTWKNYLYQILSGYLVLSFIVEVGLPFADYFVSIPVDIQTPIDHFLAAISGLGGGFIVAKLIRLLQKLN